MPLGWPLSELPSSHETLGEAHSSNDSSTTGTAMVEAVLMMAHSKGSVPSKIIITHRWMQALIPWSQKQIVLRGAPLGLRSSGQMPVFLDGVVSGIREE